MAIQTRMTLDEFLAMPDIDERRLELIDGEVCEKVSPRWGHGRLTGFLGQLLNEFGHAAVEPRAVIRGTANFGPSSPLPDVAFYRSAPPADDEWMTSPPDVAVEILSPGQSRREMRAKVDLYRAFGIPSVWVVDLERREVEIYEGERRILAGTDLIDSKHAPGFAIAVDALFAGPPAPRAGV